jgi:hypothetical protein
MNRRRSSGLFQSNFGNVGASSQVSYTVFVVVRSSRTHPRRHPGDRTRNGTSRGRCRVVRGQVADHADAACVGRLDEPQIRVVAAEERIDGIEAEASWSRCRRERRP